MPVSALFRVSAAVAGVEGGLFALQAVSGNDGISPGAAVLAGFSTILVAGGWALWRRQDAHKREAHEDRDKDRKDLAEWREKRAFDFGELKQGAEETQRRLAALEAKIDSVGSKIAAQVENALVDRADRPIDRLELRFDNLIQALGKAREGA